MPASRGHIGGKKLQGSHTSVSGDADKLLKALEGEVWLVSMRAGEIENTARGGNKSLTIKTPPETSVHEHTLHLRIRTNSYVQHLFIHVLDGDFATAVPTIIQKAQKKMRGVTIYDKTQAV